MTGSSAPATQPSVIAIERLFTPFPGIGRQQDGTYPEIVPLQYLDTWGQTARSGYYPFGANAQWHGGIHFDGETGRRFYQEGGIRCVADGEVIAYRYNHEPPFTEDAASSRKSHYSTGFVLVRHRLQMPRDQMPTTHTGALPEVTLYSLYMHLLHINSYFYNPRLDRPSFWTPYPNRWRVAANANDAQPARTANASWAPDGADVSQQKGAYLRRRDNQENVAWLPCGAQLTLGEGAGDWQPVASVGPEDFSVPSNGPLSSIGNSLLYHSQHLLWRAPGTENIPLNQLEIRVALLEKVLEPPTKEPDKISTPANPIPIAAGALIGHVGNYLRPEDVEVHQNQRPQFHLELFAAESDLTRFITTCRGHAQNAPDKAKTLIKIGQGARLVRPAQADLTIPAREAIRLDDNSPVGGEWYQVRRGTLQEVASNTLQGYDNNAQSYADNRLLYRALRANNAANNATNDITANAFNLVHKDGTPRPPTQNEPNGYTPTAAQIANLNSYTRRIVFVDNGQTVWLDRLTYTRIRAVEENSNYNNIIRLVNPLAVWTNFPLRTDQNINPQANNGLKIIEKKSIDVIATDAQGNRWWRINYIDPNGNNIDEGWACERGHPNVELITPWAWPGFEFVEEDPTTPREYDRMRRENRFPRDRTLFTPLFRIIDQNNREALTLAEICSAWRDPRLTRALSRLVICHQSEWGMEMRLWDEIDSEVGEANKAAWEEEKKVIKNLKFWEGARGQHGFPSAITMDHMHPLALIDNFDKKCKCRPEICNATYHEFTVPQGIMRVSTATLDDLRAREAYSERPYVPVNSATSGITIGYGYDLGHQNEAAVRRELRGLYTPDEINRFVAVIGRRFRGDNARAALPQVQNITINEANALTLAYRTKERYGRYVADMYPEVLKFHPFCQGALLSMVFNRGERLNAADPTRREMREIQQDFRDNRPERIPDRLRLMKRLWMGIRLRGLLDRRDQEAVFFTRGMRCSCFENK